MDPIAILGQYNKLGFDQPKNGDVALAALDKLPETTEEIRNCCADLKVLGRKEFKLLLKWRLKVREIFGFPTKKTTKEEAAEEVAEVEPMDEELRIQEELQKMKEKESSKKKRERRRENEKKQKEIVRMQMNMTAPMDIGMEQEGPRGEGAMFRLKGIDETPALNRIAKGKMIVVKEVPKKDRDSGLGSSGETDDESDEDGDRLETELDALYDEYRERKMEADAKYRAKKARQEHDDEEWEGVSADEKGDSDDEELEGFEESSDEDDDEPVEAKATGKPLLRDLDDAPSGVNGLSKRAANFFQQGIFQDIPGLLDFSEEEEDNDDEDMADAPSAPEPREEPATTAKSKPAKSKAKAGPPPKEAEDEDGCGFEVVKKDEDEDWEETEKRTKDGRPSKSPVWPLACCDLMLTNKQTSTLLLLRP